ncbi:chromosome segregation protein SMC [Candidatus Thiomargarita nelsonii]|uniref:Chromosome segregation protein SMC n=1 Tax=Candidatus Thiomargarita nelsonii TaxID=1003181 RepID=A0A0A6P1M3_9GAMM|nr:chromosome segregation protein SMC [Candidatus Thiomargarita nelsonii]
MKTQIEQIKVKNFRLYRDLHITDLQRLNVFLGANGSGKTTFFKVFNFLSTCLKDNVTVAVNREGGFKELITRNSDPEKNFIEFEIKFRNFEQGEKSPLVTYHLKIGFNHGKVFIDKEVLKYRRGQRGKPWHFLDYSKGIGSAIKNEQDYDPKSKEIREDQPLGAEDILALKGLGQFERYKTIKSFRTLLEQWLVSNLQNEEMRKIGDVGADQQLSMSGNNLAQVASFIHEYHPDIFQTILTKMKQRVPGIDKVDIAINEAGQILLKFGDNSFTAPFISKYTSDGTIKMFAYLVLLHDPTPRPLLCIEEPENYLYPTLLRELAAELREYAVRGGQVFVSTHSPDFVDALQIEELFLVKKEQNQGCSHIFSAKKYDDGQISELYDNGCELGWLWQHDYFKGINP